jgi:glycosyltransferase involved in cell wall biosynthesis
MSLSGTDWVRAAVEAARHSPLRLLLKHERFTNRERHREFNFTLLESRERRGVTALVRARNEQQKIQHCLRSIAPLFDEIIVVDNASDDRTLALVREFKERSDPADKIKICSYPFRLARFGPEHDGTPGDSVSSAVYYSNWALSQCSRRYVCKWDADMVLRKQAREQFLRLLVDVQNQQTCWTLPGQTVYRDVNGEFYLSTNEVNKEIMLFPYGYWCRFYKIKHWESLQSRPRLPVEDFPPVTFYELKFVDEDEFGHWSTTEWPSERKKKEWTNFHAVKRGEMTGGRFEKLPAGFLNEETP